MDWETIIYELKKINPEHLGERSLTTLKDELEKYLEKVKGEIENRTW